MAHCSYVLCLKARRSFRDNHNFLTTLTIPAAVPIPNRIFFLKDLMSRLRHPDLRADFPGPGEIGHAMAA